ncbi:N-acetylmuramate alpha-1-phosphate uridylyltransferase MurU [Catenovulum sediminis]|uniref:N-acetylmuramate alpha-1-phosphate uridylyltransferase MurU n=1 Tax=Catenovulum sediminis TaxID=1740262 RepID=A0ABV1RK62_9ALTE|nr:nucleotidyltransferase family protein [Catenovulum sediminis]
MQNNPINTAMILAAGRGMRMRPLTDKIPKPLLKVAGKHLIEYHINALVAAGIENIVINTAWLGEQIPQTLGDGEKYGCRLLYSPEPVGAYETAGGIINALPLIDTQNFLLVNGDVWCDYCFENLLAKPLPGGTAKIVLVNNPEHNLNGDFALTDGIAQVNGTDKLTYSGIGLFEREFFTGYADFPLSLGKVLRDKIAKRQVFAEFFKGTWFDIGTPDRLKYLDNYLKSNQQ